MNYRDSLGFLDAFFSRPCHKVPYRSRNYDDFQKSFTTRATRDKFGIMVNNTLTILQDDIVKVKGVTRTISERRHCAARQLMFSPTAHIIQTLFHNFPDIIKPRSDLSDAEKGVMCYHIPHTASNLAADIPALSRAILEAYIRGLVDAIDSTTQIAHNAFQCNILSKPQLKGGDSFGPIFVIGLPRSGTTVMHKLLSLDPHARVPTNGELLTPSSFDGPDGRMIRALEYRGETGETSRFAELDPQEPAEDSMLFTMCGAGRTEGMGDATDMENDMLVRWNLLKRDKLDMFCLHRMIARLLERSTKDVKNRTHWVFKDPSHLKDHLVVICKVYPNARFVWTHRALEDVIMSWMDGMELSDYSKKAYIELTARTVNEGLHFRKYGLYKDPLNPFDRDAPTGGHSQEFRFQDVYLDDIAEDPVSVVRGLYKAWGKQMSDEYVSTLEKWQGEFCRAPKAYEADEDVGKLFERQRHVLQPYYAKFRRVQRVRDVDSSVV